MLNSVFLVRATRFDFRVFGGAKGLPLQSNIKTPQGGLRRGKSKKWTYFLRAGAIRGGSPWINPRTPINSGDFPMQKS
jgi:hypothetical protein